MRVTNEPSDQPAPGGAFGELVRLQTEFSTRLAEETVKYLRSLQGALGPASPGTVVIPDPDFEASADGAPGSTATIVIELENLQRVHSLVTPKLTPLVSSEGVTWFANGSAGSSSLLIPPDGVKTVEYVVDVPTGLPGGIYRGAMILVGFQENALPVRLEVLSPKKAAARKSATKKSATKKSATKRATTKKSATKRSATKTSATKKSATKKATAKKTTTKKPRSRQTRTKRSSS